MMNALTSDSISDKYHQKKFGQVSFDISSVYAVARLSLYCVRAFPGRGVWIATAIMNTKGTKLSGGAKSLQSIFL